MKTLVVVNQAANYLTIGYCNELLSRVDRLVLMTGSVHVQGETLDSRIEISPLPRWSEAHGARKLLGYVSHTIRIGWRLLRDFPRAEVLWLSQPPIGYLLAIILPHRFSSLVWDIYPDLFALIGMGPNHPLVRWWARLNRWAFARTHRLLTISAGMADRLSTYVPRDRIHVVSLWSIFQAPPLPGTGLAFRKTHGLADAFLVQYSGNIGLSHNVDVLIDVAKVLAQRAETRRRDAGAKDYPRVVIQLIGRGPKKATLAERVASEQLSNCQFLPFQTDEDFPESLAAADLGVVALDPRIAAGAVPSKSYNLMAYGIPSLYLAAPESTLAQYVARFGHGVCLAADDPEAVADTIERIASDAVLRARYREGALAAHAHFKRENARQLADILFPLASPEAS